MTRTELEELLFKKIVDHNISSSHWLVFNECVLGLLGDGQLPKQLSTVYPLLERYNKLLSLNEEELHAVKSTYRSLIGTGGLYCIAEVIYDYSRRTDPMYLPHSWCENLVRLVNEVSSIIWRYKHP